MIKLKVAFYKAYTGNIVDKAIGLWTVIDVLTNKKIKNSYSHVEIIIDSTFDNVGTTNSFSSSVRDGGVRFANINYNPKKWDIIDIEINKTYKEFINECNKYLGCRYDLLGIFLHEFVPVHIHNPIKWYCSEIISKIVLGLDDNKCQMSPNLLYLLLQDKLIKEEK